MNTHIKILWFIGRKRIEELRMTHTKRLHYGHKLNVKQIKAVN